MYSSKAHNIKTSNVFVLDMGGWCSYIFEVLETHSQFSINDLITHRCPTACPAPDLPAQVLATIREYSFPSKQSTSFSWCFGMAKPLPFPGKCHCKGLVENAKSPLQKLCHAPAPMVSAWGWGATLVVWHGDYLVLCRAQNLWQSQISETSAQGLQAVVKIPRV